MRDFGGEAGAGQDNQAHEAKAERLRVMRGQNKWRIPGLREELGNSAQAEGKKYLAVSYIITLIIANRHILGSELSALLKP